LFRYITGYGGKLAPAKTLEGLMAALDAHLKTRQQRLQQVFDEMDSDGNGYLDPHELARLLRGLFPSEVGLCKKLNAVHA
jgi:Ca2+-binding EF-hand superfamily protein